MKKMKYEKPFIEIVPSDLDNLLKNAFSDVDDGYGGRHKVDNNGDDPDSWEGMSKGWYESWEDDWSAEYWD